MIKEPVRVVLCVKEGIDISALGSITTWLINRSASSPLCRFDIAIVILALAIKKNYFSPQHH